MYVVMRRPIYKPIYKPIYIIYVQIGLDSRPIIYVVCFVKGHKYV